MNVLLCKLYNIFLSPRTNNFKGNVNIYGRGSLFSFFILQVQVLTFYFACTYSLINDICTLIESLSNPPPPKKKTITWEIYIKNLYLWYGQAVYNKSPKTFSFAPLLKVFKIYKHIQVHFSPSPGQCILSKSIYMGIVKEEIMYLTALIRNFYKIQRSICYSFVPCESHDIDFGKCVQLYFICHLP